MHQSRDQSDVMGGGADHREQMSPNRGRIFAVGLECDVTRVSVFERVGEVDQIMAMLRVDVRGTNDGRMVVNRLGEGMGAAHEIQGLLRAPLRTASELGLDGIGLLVDFDRIADLLHHREQVSGVLVDVIVFADLGMLRCGAVRDGSIRLRDLRFDTGEIRTPESMCDGIIGIGGIQSGACIF